MPTTLALLLFLIHEAIIRDVVFVGIIVAFCRRYDGHVSPTHVPPSSASAGEGTS